MSERTLLEAALARLDDAAMAVKHSSATNEQQHQILGCLVGAYSLLGALSRVDPAAVDELLQRAIRLRARVSQPKSGSGRRWGRMRTQDRHAVPALDAMAVESDARHGRWVTEGAADSATRPSQASCAFSSSSTARN